MTDTFTVLFLAALAVSVVVRLWLGQRQGAHVSAHRDAVPAEFADRIALAAHRKAADYTLAKLRFGRVALAVETVVLLAWTLGGGLAALAGFWQARVDGLAYGLALILSFMAIAGAVDLPLALWRQFAIEARFGFNRMTLGLFFADLAKSTLLGLAIGGPVVLAILWLMQSMGERWWLWVWLFWNAFSLILMFVFPTWIAPLFNKFAPLAEGETKARVEALLERCGFRASGLFVMDGSRRSAHGNAYFTGFGRNRRIVFFDTLLTRLSPTEIEAVLAHELGHFRLHHVLHRIGLSLVMTLAALAALGQLIDAPWFYAGLGAPAIAGHDTALALLLFFLAAPPFVFLATPAGSLLSRQQEFGADRYAAAHADAGELVQALVKLYEDNAATLTPDPVHSLFYDSHPPAPVRVARLRALAAT